MFSLSYSISNWSLQEFHNLETLDNPSPHTEVEIAENLLVRHLNNFYSVSAMENCFKDKSESRTIWWYWIEFSYSYSPYRQNSSLCIKNKCIHCYCVGSYCCYRSSHNQHSCTARHPLAKTQW